MSIRPFRFTPDKFVKHDDIDFREAKSTMPDGIFGESECNQKRGTSVDAKSVLLRDDHIVLFAIDCLPGAPCRR